VDDVFLRGLREELAATGDNLMKIIQIKLTAYEFINTNPNVAGGRGSALNFYKRAK
jgi:hypothetical protein